MSTAESWNKSGEPERVKSIGWKELDPKEDWWAILLGLGVVVAVNVLPNFVLSVLVFKGFWTTPTH